VRQENKEKFDPQGGKERLEEVIKTCGQ